jgi:hypothetical protein
MYNMQKIITGLIITLSQIVSNMNAQQPFVVLHQEMQEQSFSRLKNAYIFSPVYTTSDSSLYTITLLEQYFTTNVPIVDSFYILQKDNKIHYHGKNKVLGNGFKFGRNTTVIQEETSIFDDLKLFQDYYDQYYIKSDSTEQQGIYFDTQKNRWLGWREGNNRYVVFENFPISNVIHSYNNNWEKKGFLPEEMKRKFRIVYYSDDKEPFLIKDCTQPSFIIDFKGAIKHNKYEFSCSALKIPMGKKYVKEEAFSLDVAKNTYSLYTKIEVLHKNTDSLQYIIQWLEPLYSSQKDTYFVARQWKNTVVKTEGISSNSVDGSMESVKTKTSNISWNKGITYGPLNSIMYISSYHYPQVWEVLDENGNALPLLQKQFIDDDVLCTSLIRLYKQEDKLMAQVMIGNPCELKIKWELNGVKYNKDWDITESGMATLELGKAPPVAQKIDVTLDIITQVAIKKNTTTTQSQSIHYGIIDVL